MVTAAFPTAGIRLSSGVACRVCGREIATRYPDGRVVAVIAAVRVRVEVYPGNRATLSCPQEIGGHRCNARNELVA